MRKPTLIFSLCSVFSYMIPIRNLIEDIQVFLEALLNLVLGEKGIDHPAPPAPLVDSENHALRKTRHCISLFLLSLLDYAILYRRPALHAGRLPRACDH